MKRVRNAYGVESLIPDDYPEALIRQLQLEVVEEAPQPPPPSANTTNPEEPPKEKPRRRR